MTPKTTPRQPAERTDRSQMRSVATFNDLLDMMLQVSTNLQRPLHPALVRTRGSIAAEAAALAPGLPFCEDTLSKALAAGSLPVLRALVEPPENRPWAEAFECSSTAFKDTPRPADVFSYDTADADFIAYLFDNGFKNPRTVTALGARFLCEASEVLDPVAEEVFGTRLPLVLRAMERQVEPLRRMASVGGLRHLKALEQLLQSGSGPAQRQMVFHARRLLRNTDWKGLSLLLRLGADLSCYANDQGEEIASLFHLSGSKHGQIKLRALEPDLEDLALRPREKPRFGLFEIQLSGKIHMGHDQS